VRTLRCAALTKVGFVGMPGGADALDCLERAARLRDGNESRRAESDPIVPDLIANVPRHVDIAVDIQHWLSGTQ
jgi:hypothetical protein